MSGTHTFKAINLRASFLLIAGLSLAGCENGELSLPFFNSSGESDAPLAAADAGPIEERDVEAPEVFSVTDQGLWDGRPSLGGVWVAHPDVADPERVVIKNEASGEVVIGALFRRERENPGPVLQVSSDAAEALGMLAGNPQTLSVIALRREAAPATPPIAAPRSEFDTAETVAPEAPSDVTATTLEPVTTTSLEAPAASSDGPLAPIGAPLDASSDPLAGAAAAIEAAEAAAPAPAPAPVPQPTSGLSRPFIQIGIFSVEANANAAASRMTDAGLPARVLAQTSQGRAFWRVLVGPASSEAARSSTLDQVKGLGFTDAYFVTD